LISLDGCANRRFHHLGIGPGYVASASLGANDIRKLGHRNLGDGDEAASVMTMEMTKAAAAGR